MTAPCNAPHPAYSTTCTLPAGHGNAHEGELDAVCGEPIPVIWVTTRSRRTS